MGIRGFIESHAPVGCGTFEIKSSHTFNKSFVKNLDYLKGLLGEKVCNSAVVYDGDNIPLSVINIRYLTRRF